ncbi:helix-turn-helix domain-containing protein, partial [Streptococcus pneumoniae]|uniref:helix-turn-helix domain-containing protein n=1 Tax=Streptococcus pneumoniae TaxID=1313 RepID=UPI000ADCC529
MRYDFGKVYKEIRESKGLTQEEVCGGVLSRTSLSKIESGKTTPKYENMEFLLRQINMSFEEMLEVVIYIRQHGAGELSDHAEQVVKKLWRKIEKQDTWYESDLKILNTILFSFPIEYLHLITGKILQRLEVYKNYQHLYDLRIAILLNLSTLYLYNQ